MARSMRDLVEWCDPSSTVLLLGAGVSMPSGAPSWELLRDHVVADVIPNLQVQGDLPLIGEIIENEVGRRALVESVIKHVDVEPTGGIRALPKFPWRGIYTTNYDRLIEKAAVEAGVEIAIIRSRFDLPELEHRSKLPIFKLHGCISEDRAFGAPSFMVITKSDYRSVRRWKADLLRRMQSDLEVGKLLIIGQSLADQHLDELIDDALAFQQEMGLRDRVSLLLFSGEPEIQRVFEARGLKVTIGDIDWFASEMSKRVPPKDELRNNPTSTDMQYLTDTLAAITVSVSEAVRIPTPIRKMVNGAAATYFDISRGRTFERELVPVTIERLSRFGTAVILGAAGFGKTTMARQVIAQARSEHGVLAWEHRTDLPLDVKEWLAVNARLANDNVHAILLLDNATTYQRAVNDLLKGLERASNRALWVLVTAENHRWARLIKHPSLMASDPLRPRLTTAEVQRLLLLARSNSELAPFIPHEFNSLSRHQQRVYLERQCGADIFICLKNIFSSTGFATIVLEEFAALPDDLQEVYKLVAALESLAGGSHRQLILRMLGLHHEQISRVLTDLTGLMAESSTNVADGIYVWRTRHPEIADIITRFKYSDPDDHLQLVQDLVEHIRPTIDIEKNAIRNLCNNALGLDNIKSSADRVDLIEQLVELLPRDHVLRHRLVREFVRSRQYVEAEQVLEQAILAVGLDPPLLRYRIELYRLRAEEDRKIQPQDREALLRWAWADCEQAMRRYSDNWYTYRSAAEVAEDWFDLTNDDDWLRIAQLGLRAAQSRLFEPELDRHIARVDELLRWNSVTTES
ncbi:SIR2 family protein [Desertihabitans aurantiacus]|uniref:SIR2 family protein n=1 Tax=Desertihabitans aurantiacus TaxID=2282477 RepID=UPI000DF77370|nr:SIR2 family protein [Desertihabitans aurantiacus]